jgi:hypothetical protein
VDLAELTRSFDRHKATYQAATANVAQNKALASQARRALKDISESTAFINEAVKLTQDQIKGQIESLVTAAMDMVFDEHYDFELQFNRVGNRLDCRAVLRDGDRVMDDPEFDVGGSRVDTVSIALRVVVWSLEEEQPRGVFILDEPFTSLGSSHLLDRTLEMVQRLSQELGLQMIIFTHIERAQAIADRAWHVTNIGGRATAEVVAGAPPQPVTERIKA